MRRLVYDCEIIRLIPPRDSFVVVDSNEENAWFNRFGDGYQYCGGWNDFKNMGISVIGVCDIDTEEQFYFSSREVDVTATYYPIPEFSKFVANHEVWGFNSHNFDDRLCRVQLLWVWSKFDLLKLIRIAAFGSTSWEGQPYGYSYSLGKIAAANGMAKSGSGELAPKLWQDGKHQEVIDYCLNDCLITARLIKLFERGALIDPNTGEKLNVTS